jgi:hypothetical protein
MKFKYIAFVLSLASISYAQGAQRNLCDDLVDSGTSSSEQIKKCLDDPRFGPSDHYKELEANKKIKVETAKVETADAAKKKDNLEIKKFNSDDLFDAGFGKPFYAIRGDYRNHRYKEKRITEGDALCSYLGYEKAIKSIVSPELWENKNGNVKVDKQGLIVDTNMLGIISKTPEIYHDEDYKFTVRKYVEITCVRRKDKAIDGSVDALKAVTEDLLMLNEELNASSKRDSNTGVNNGSRTNSGKDGKTTNGYNPPDWAKDSQTISK